MKKTFLFLVLSLLLCTQAQAADIGFLKLHGGGAGGGAACEEASNEIGYRSVATTNRPRPTDNIWCNLWTADCTGNLATAYLYSYSNDGATTTVCVYSDDGDNAPGSGDLKIDCTGHNALEDVPGDGASAAMGTGAAVTSGSKYFICWGTDAVIWTAKTDVGQPAWNKALANPSTIMPANLDGTWTETADRKQSNYVTIGP